MKTKYCETEKELVSLVKRCMLLKLHQHAPSVKAMATTKEELKGIEVLDVTHIKYLVTHLFRMLHRAKFSHRIYTDLIQLSAEFDYLQSHGTWHYVQNDKGDE